MNVIRDHSGPSRTVRRVPYRNGLGLFDSKPGRKAAFHPLPPLAWAAVGALALWSLFTSNASLTVGCAVTLALVASLLWKQAESPVLLFSCAMQWLQVAMPVLNANVNGMSLSELYRPTYITRATWLSLMGVVVLALGIRTAWIGLVTDRRANLETALRQLDPRRVFAAWLISLGVATGVGIVAWRVPGMNQILYATGTIKWVVFFLLSYGVFVRDVGYSLFFVAVLIEFLTGVTGYFAGFTLVFFMMILTAFTLGSRLRPRTLTLLAATCVFVVSASLLWTAIKKPYRHYLNQGTGQQVVAVPVMARFQKLQELLVSVTEADLMKGVDDLVARVSYSEYFAHTISHVPRVVPFERGRLWWGAITHVFTPRMFFPDKAALNDSARTVRYTGIRVAGSEGGTSIGIGYMGESYIDFGPYGMFVPIFLLGALYGLVYRYFVSTNRSHLFGVALATGVLFLTWQAFATSNVKLVGGLLTQCIAMIGLDWVFGSRFMNALRYRQPLDKERSKQV